MPRNRIYVGASSYYSMTRNVYTLRPHRIYNFQKPAFHSGPISVCFFSRLLKAEGVIPKCFLHIGQKGHIRELKVHGYFLNTFIRIFQFQNDVLYCILINKRQCPLTAHLFDNP